MVDVGARGSIDASLQLAQDLCLGVGAFLVTPTGEVDAIVSEAMPPEDGLRRIEQLARNCLTHPAADGRELFWNAEESTEADSADLSLACVAIPLRSGGEKCVGLLGVVDTWLPEPEEEERAALVAIGAELAEGLACGGPAPSSDGCGSAGPVDVVDLVSNLDDGILCLDASATVVLANRDANRLHGLPEGRSLLGARLPDVTALRTEEGQLVTAESHPGVLALRNGARCTAQLLLGADGEHQLHVSVTARPFVVDGRDGALVVMHDSTAEWRERQRLTHYALFDPLTGLANRYLLLEELRRMLLSLDRRGGTVALVYLDLDGFKQVNDQYGHETGDEVLAAVARRLRGAVRGDDLVSRLGGDEFVIAHASTERLPDGDVVVSRLRKVLSAPFRVRNRALDVGASIGWVSTDSGEEGPDALLAKADRAMYLQKRNRALTRRGAA